MSSCVIRYRSLVLFVCYCADEQGRRPAFTKPTLSSAAAGHSQDASSTPVVRVDPVTGQELTASEARAHINEVGRT